MLSYVTKIYPWLEITIHVVFSLFFLSSVDETSLLEAYSLFSLCFMIQILGTPCWILWLRVKQIIHSCLLVRCALCLKNSHAGVASTQNQVFPRLWPKHANFHTQFSSSFTILNVWLTLYRWYWPNIGFWSQNRSELVVRRYCPNGSISLIFCYCTLSSVIKTLISNQGNIHSKGFELMVINIWTGELEMGSCKSLGFTVWNSTSSTYLDRLFFFFLLVLANCKLCF